LPCFRAAARFVGRSLARTGGAHFIAADDL